MCINIAVTYPELVRKITSESRI